MEGWKTAIKLLEALEARRPGVRFDGLNRDLFSRRLYAFLYERGAFPPNRYNDYDGRNDYEFMVKMFRRRTALNGEAAGKDVQILNKSIFPWLHCFAYELREEGL